GTHRRARANRSKARKSLRRIAVAMLNFFRVDAEPAGEQTRKNGGMALAGRLHITAQDQLVVPGKRHRSLLHRQRAGMLQPEGHANTAQLLASRRFAPTLVEVG